jgi:hypothetical protein
MGDIILLIFFILYSLPIVYQVHKYKLINTSEVPLTKLTVLLIVMVCYALIPLYFILLAIFSSSDKCLDCGMEIIGGLIFTIIGITISVIVYLVDYFQTIRKIK